MVNNSLDWRPQKESYAASSFAERARDVVGHQQEADVLIRRDAGHDGGIEQTERTAHLTS